MRAKAPEENREDEVLVNAISRKKGELMSVILRKKRLVDGEVVNKSAELDRLLVEYMRAR